jgi:hypothetical protein
MNEAVDERIGRLYALPLEQFTAERNALAKELRKEGDRESADAVKGFKKPSIEAWTVNQLTRQHGDEVVRLVELGEEQADVLGSGDREQLRRAMDDVRRTLTSLANHAEQILGSSDRKPTSTLLERVTRMLQNAAGTEEGRGALRQGRFTAELEPTDLPDVEVVAPPTTPRVSSRPRPERPAQEPAKERAAAARQRSEDEAERARLEHALRRAEEQARLLREKAEDLDGRAAEAREAAVAAEQAVDEAREAVVAHQGR